MNCIDCSTPITGRRRGAVYCTERCRANAAHKRHAIRHPDRIAANRWDQNEKTARRMYTRTKSRAKRTGIPFAIEVSDIIVPSHCPVLGIALIPHQGKKGYFNDSPSLDKFIPALGYVRGNIRVISARANLLKNNASVDELDAVLSDMRSRRC